MALVSIVAGWIFYWLLYAVVRAAFGTKTNAWGFIFHFLLCIGVFALVRYGFNQPVHPMLWLFVGPLLGAWFLVFRITLPTVAKSPERLKSLGIALTLGLTHFLAQSGAAISMSLGLIAGLVLSIYG
ncbi:MAG TPA: hypothetical protein VN808_01025 [Stellaceae bacterium]|nr:hypothetical protein [Stellaceae bacterium]